jgi:hypothetical protein
MLLQREASAAAMHVARAGCWAKSLPGAMASGMRHWDLTGPVHAHGAADYFCLHFVTELCKADPNCEHNRHGCRGPKAMGITLTRATATHLINYAATSTRPRR